MQLDAVWNRLTPQAGLRTRSTRVQRWPQYRHTKPERPETAQTDRHIIRSNTTPGSALLSWIYASPSCLKSIRAIFACLHRDVRSNGVDPCLSWAFESAPRLRQVACGRFPHVPIATPDGWSHLVDKGPRVIVL